MTDDRIIVALGDTAAEFDRLFMGVDLASAFRTGAAIARLVDGKLQLFPVELGELYAAEPPSPALSLEKMRNVVEVLRKPPVTCAEISRWFDEITDWPAIRAGAWFGWPAQWPEEGLSRRRRRRLRGRTKALRRQRRGAV